MLDIYLDADGCPVREEAYRVAERYSLRVLVVCNRPIRVPPQDRIERVVVGEKFDAADDFIAERAGAGDIVVTADLLLADRCLRSGARVLGHKGQILDEDSIGQALATRELMAGLRDLGQVTGGPTPMAPRDRSRFLARLDDLVQAVRRQGA